MGTDVRIVALIEELAANAWPAYTQQSYGAWKLRATFGTTKRANSVFTVGPMPEDADCCAGSSGSTKDADCLFVSMSVTCHRMGWMRSWPDKATGWRWIARSCSDVRGRCWSG